MHLLSFLKGVPLALGLSGLVCPLIKAVEPPAPARPNVLIIMADDMGWSDLGAYGGEIRTPHLDRLAEQGVRFTRAYNTAKCFPSRATLLTGIYAQSSGMDRSARSSLQHAVTIGEVLRDAGYHTLAVGKHHGTDNLYDRGFDHYFGLRDGACNHFNPGLPRPGEPEPGNKGFPRSWADDALVFDTRDPAYQHYFPAGFYSTDAFTDKAIAYLKAHDPATRPFLLYLAYTAPHDPLHAWPEDIARYEGVYESGFETIRQARYERQLAMGLIDAERYPLHPAQHREWSQLSAAEQADQARRMQVYAAMIDHLDQSIGRILAQLEEMGMLENTLILFTSDNGASAEDVNLGSGEIGSMERFASQQKDWANVSNTPFGHWKNYSHEGGINAPLIAHWPAGLERPGRIDDTPVHFIDFMPTLVELSGATYPTTWRGEAIHPVAGLSFVDVLKDDIQPRNRVLYWKWGGWEALFDGRYKFVRATDGRWEVYDTEKNRTETENIWAQSRHLTECYDGTFQTWLETASQPPAVPASP